MGVVYCIISIDDHGMNLYNLLLEYIENIHALPSSPYCEVLQNKQFDSKLASSQGKQMTIYLQL